jgi:hypothetical protein
MLQFLRSLLRLFGISPKYVTSIQEDFPDKLQEKKLYLIGDLGNYWLAAMKCPCGCGDVIQLSLSMTSRPRWQVTGLDQEPTLNPSVHRTTGCRSHFFVCSGKILWCP